jgi:hypothetical protein
MDPPPLNSARRLAAIDADDLAFAREFHGSQKIRNQRKQIRKPIRLGAQDQDGNVPTRKVLLVWQPFSMVTKISQPATRRRESTSPARFTLRALGPLALDTGLLSQDRVAEARSSRPFTVTSTFLNRFSHLGAGPIRRVLPWWQGVGRSGRCPKRISKPLIHRELRPNWVRSVISAFSPLVPPASGPCSLTVWLRSAASERAGHGRPLRHSPDGCRGEACLARGAPANSHPSRPSLLWKSLIG